MSIAITGSAPHSLPELQPKPAAAPATTQHAAALPQDTVSLSSKAAAPSVDRDHDGDSA